MEGVKDFLVSVLWGLLLTLISLSYFVLLVYLLMTTQQVSEEIFAWIMLTLLLGGGGVLYGLFGATVIRRAIVRLRKLRMSRQERRLRDGSHVLLPKVTVIRH